MLEKVLAISTLVALVVLLAFLQVTSPSTVHPLGILLVFILLYVLALGVLTFFIFSASHVVHAMHVSRGVLEFRQAYFYASVIALAPVILICMRTVGNVGIYEVALVIFFEFVACFYITKHK